ncbi:MAG: spore coat polysaccharide biosynthesis protein SpsF [Thermotogota bacterium]|nr:spore coat polysaccharide biosynthesis protein SpsF [Thermotogota bacterium]MDK2865291.1 spore coat polysaccharide biosynthesis protein SpsF [Thermotogota bacterium]
MKFFLEGEKVGLKKLTEEELSQKYVDWLNDMEVTKYLVSGKFPSDIEDVRRFIETANTPNRVTFAIYRKDTNEHVGNVKLDHIDWTSRKADFGIMIGDKSSWGAGIGTEVTSLILEYAFDVLNLHRIYLGVLKENLAAVKTYQKLGFVEEGVRKEDQYVEGRYLDTIVMGITKSQWLASKSKIVAVIQARMSSSRLPGKVLKPLGGKPALQRVVERVIKAQRIDEVIIATSTDPTDDPIEALCSSQKWKCFRGDLDDVLKRYHDAAKSAGAGIVVRITADCPLIDPTLIDTCIDAYKKNIEHVDYVSNIDERTFPDGLDVEVFSFKALETAYLKATSPHDREHVTPFIRRNFRKLTVSQKVDLSMLRWTLDYQEDYEVLDKIYQRFEKMGLSNFSTRDVLKLLLEDPSLILLSHRLEPSDDEKIEVRRKIEELLEETEVIEP